MAVVTSGIASTGAKWRIHDDCYIDNTPERNEALRRDTNRAAYAILVQHALNNRGGTNDAENCRDVRNRQG